MGAPAAPVTEAARQPSSPGTGRRLAWDPWAMLLSVLLAAFTVTGASFLATDSAEWFASSAGAVAGSALVTCGLAVVIYLPVLGVFRWLDRRWDGAVASAEPAIVPMRTALRRRLWPAFGVLLAGWLPWLIVHYPGNVDSDTITQKLQWLGLQERSDHHPWFDTAVFGWFWDLGDAVGDDRIGLFAYVLVQESATALGVALVLAYLSWLGLPAVAGWTLTVAVAVFPLYAMSPAVMSKDAFAVVFWLPFLVLFAEAVRTRGRVLLRPWAGAAAIAIAVPLILAKRTNVYLVVICLLVLLAISTRRAWLPILGGAGVALALTSVVWPLAVLPALGIPSGTATDMLTVPVQQTARIVQAHGDELPEEEREAIDAVLRYDGLAEAYVPRRSDNVKGRWDDEATTEEKLAYARVWLAQLARYPGTALSATAANTFEYLAPVTPMSFQNSLTLDRYVDFWHSRSRETTSREQIERIAEELREPRALDDARNAMNRATASFTEGNLLASKAFSCSWVPLTALVFAVRRRSALHMLATVPLFVNLAFLMASPVALPRYIIPLLYGAVFAIGLMLTPGRWQRRDGEGSPEA